MWYFATLSESAGTRWDQVKFSPPSKSKVRSISFIKTCSAVKQHLHWFFLFSFLCWIFEYSFLYSISTDPLFISSTTDKLCQMESLLPAWKTLESRLDQLQKDLREDEKTIHLLDSCLVNGTFNGQTASSLRDVAKVLSENTVHQVCTIFSKLSII